MNGSPPVSDVGKQNVPNTQYWLNSLDLDATVSCYLALLSTLCCNLDSSIKFEWQGVIFQQFPVEGAAVNF